MSTEPLLSIVTGACNRPASLARLVDAVTKRTDPATWELIISDCSDPEKGYVPTDPRVRVIREWPKKTMCFGYNAAFAECRGTWVLWLNDDAEPQEGYAREAIAYMSAHPDVGMGALYYCEGVGTVWRVNKYLDCTYANFGIIRRALGEEIGWFDSDLSMYGTDNSISFKVLLKNLTVTGIPKARIIHHAEWDERKIADQRLRTTDGQVVFARYSPLLPQMLAVEARNPVQPLAFAQ